MQTIFSGFSTVTDADAAVRALQQAGTDAEQINVLVQENVAKSSFDEINKARVHVNSTNAIGEQELTGLALLVANEKAVDVRGIGAVLAGGELATILANATVASNQTGEDIQSMLVEYGMSAKQAETYSNMIQQGGALLWLHDEDERIRSAAAILKQHNAKQMIMNTS